MKKNKNLECRKNLLDKHIPLAMPNKSTTAIWASPLAVISPIFSVAPLAPLLAGIAVLF